MCSIEKKYLLSSRSMRKSLVFSLILSHFYYIREHIDEIEKKKSRISGYFHSEMWKSTTKNNRRSDSKTLNKIKLIFLQKVTMCNISLSKIRSWNCCFIEIWKNVYIENTTISALEKLIILLPLEQRGNGIIFYGILF